MTTPLIHRHWNWVSGLILLLGALWVGVSADHTSGSTQGLTPLPRQGFLAPDFTLNTLQGESITLSELRGKAVMVNFWASWCGPCRQEMPDIEEVALDYQDQDLVILAVNATQQDRLDAVIEFVDTYNLTFPILTDDDGSTIRTYQIAAFPTTFFIGRDGMIQEVVIGGPMAEALLRTRVDALLEREE
jgi:peroxiredoxin